MMIHSAGPGFFILTSFFCFTMWGVFALCMQKKYAVADYFYGLGLIFIGIGALCGWSNPAIPLFDVARIVFIIFAFAAIIYQILSKE